MHELLHTCGGIVFADVWGDIQTCNCVRMQAPTAPTAVPGANDALREKHKALEGEYKALDEKYKALLTESSTWQKGCKKRTTELETLQEAKKNDLERMQQVCGVWCVVCVCGVCGVCVCGIILAFHTGRESYAAED